MVGTWPHRTKCCLLAISLPAPGEGSAQAREECSNEDGTAHSSTGKRELVSVKLSHN
jgi:hypothetical protein